ncbi:Hypothetical protein A7982_09193 [Minicystis rosea]|nr:Hypothetical protein A7982_09193 [Minicystis rosea]
MACVEVAGSVSEGTPHQAHPSRHGFLRVTPAERTHAPGLSAGVISGAA